MRIFTAARTEYDKKFNVKLNFKKQLTKLYRVVIHINVPCIQERSETWTGPGRFHKQMAYALCT